MRMRHSIWTGCLYTKQIYLMDQTSVTTSHCNFSTLAPDYRKKPKHLFSFFLSFLFFFFSTKLAQSMRYHVAYILSILKTQQKVPENLWQQLVKKNICLKIKLGGQHLWGTIFPGVITFNRKGSRLPPLSLLFSEPLSLEGWITCN